MDDLSKYNFTEIEKKIINLEEDEVDQFLEESKKTGNYRQISIDEFLESLNTDEDENND